MQDWDKIPIDSKVDQKPFSYTKPQTQLTIQEAQRQNQQTQITSRSAEDKKQDSDHKQSPSKNPKQGAKVAQKASQDSLASSANKSKKKIDQMSKQIKKTLTKKNLWHCDIALKNGQKCNIKPICSRKMKTHLQAKFHFGPNYVHQDTFPEGIKQCSGKDCKLCQRQKANQAGLKAQVAKQNQEDQQTNQIQSLFPQSASFNLDIEDPGRLRESALLQLSAIRKTKAKDLPQKSANWWIKLHKSLNHEANLQALSKGAIDKHDRETLEALGILQLQVWHSGEINLGQSWAPILERVASCMPAAEAVIDYLLSFHGKREEDREEIRELLENHLAYITPSTVWMLSLETFWQLQEQMVVRLQASFTISDRFDGNSGNLVNLAQMLKYPGSLSQVWLNAVIRQNQPLTWKELIEKYWDALLAIPTTAQVMQVADLHLQDWPATLFGNQPLHQGFTVVECWNKMKEENNENFPLMPESPPECPPDYLFETSPILFPNQKAITLLALTASRQKNTWVYVHQPTGTGKTTLMVELGYLVALEYLTPTGKAQIKVHLVVPSTELANLHELNFAKKQAEADQRVKFFWEDHAQFKQLWKANPSAFIKDVVLIDEGDMMLTRDISDRSIPHWPRSWILLSALPKSSWTGTQSLSFQTGKGKNCIYLDVCQLFPQSNQDRHKKDPLLLRPNPSQIVEFASQKAKNQAVLFWGSLKEYSKYPGWPSGDSLIQVSKQLKENAKSFLEKLRIAKDGFYFLNSETDIEFIRAWDFRNSTSKGITLILATPFDSKSSYLQAKGRVIRGNDEGQVYTLPRQMWLN